MGEAEVLAELLGQRPLGGNSAAEEERASRQVALPLLIALGAAGLWIWLSIQLVERLYTGSVIAMPNDPRTASLIGEGIIFFGVIGVALVARRLCPVVLSGRAAPAWRSALLGFCLGAAGLCATFGAAILAGQSSLAVLTVATGYGVLLLGALKILFQTATEELFFRGWVQPFAARAWGQVAGLAIGSLAFTALHIFGGVQDPLSYFNICLAGLFFGLLALKTGGLAAPLAAHFAWNGIEQMVFGLSPNPGVGSFGSIADYELAGIPIWGGSTEGLNASIATTITLLILNGGLWLWKRTSLHKVSSLP